MKIIDCHTHPLFHDKELQEFAKRAGVEFSLNGLIKEMKENNVEKILAISIHNERNNKVVEELANKEDFVKPVYWVDVEKISKKSLKIIEKEIERFAAIKLTPGRQYFYPNEEKCNKIYELAKKYDKPVMIHTGDPFYNFAKIKYTHPIYVDDVAVEHPNIKIVLAHAGNPWIEDATEIAYKNENVYLDISGWFFKSIPKDYGKIMIQKLKFILSYLETPDKILFGTDWPLVKMKRYIGFIKNSGINKSELKRILYKNALNLFW